LLHYTNSIARVYSCSKWKPKYLVENAEGTAIFAINGPCCPCQCICCPRDIEFPVCTFLVNGYYYRVVVHTDSSLSKIFLAK